MQGIYPKFITRETKSDYLWCSHVTWVDTFLHFNFMAFYVTFSPKII